MRGGKRPSGRGEGYYFEPTLLADVPPDALIAREETFSPIAAVCAFDTEEEVRAFDHSTLVLSFSPARRSLDLSTRPIWDSRTTSSLAISIKHGVRSSVSSPATCASRSLCLGAELSDVQRHQHRQPYVCRITFWRYQAERLRQRSGHWCWHRRISHHQDGSDDIGAVVTRRRGDGEDFVLITAMRSCARSVCTAICTMLHREDMDKRE